MTARRQVGADHAVGPAGDSAAQVVQRRTGHGHGCQNSVALRGARTRAAAVGRPPPRRVYTRACSYPPNIHQFPATQNGREHGGRRRKQKCLPTDLAVAECACEWGLSVMTVPSGRGWHVLRKAFACWRRPQNRKRLATRAAIASWKRHEPRETVMNRCLRIALTMGVALFAAGVSAAAGDAAEKRPAAQRPDILIADFEGPDYGDWTVTGDAFGSGPKQGNEWEIGPIRATATPIPWSRATRPWERSPRRSSASNAATSPS